MLRKPVALMIGLMELKNYNSITQGRLTRVQGALVSCCQRFTDVLILSYQPRVL